MLRKIFQFYKKRVKKLVERPRGGGVRNLTITHWASKRQDPRVKLGQSHSVVRYALSLQDSGGAELRERLIN